MDHRKQLVVRVVGALQSRGDRRQHCVRIVTSAAQPASGQFQARYRPDGSGPPDDRGLQLDGSGWAVWALDQVAAQLPSKDDRRQLVADFGALLDRSVDAILVSTGNGTSLPPASADYWETPERRVTLATCSVLLTGLRSAEQLYGMANDPRQVALGLVAQREHAAQAGVDPRGEVLPGEDRMDADPSRAGLVECLPQCTRRPRRSVDTDDDPSR